MSKTVIRNGMFETNSSSVHSICISKKPVENVKGKKIAFYLGEYGWENSTVDTPDYLYTAIMCQSNSEELLDKLKSILDKYEIDYTFQPEDKAKWYGIDHGYETDEYISRDVALRQLNATCLATDCDNYNGVRCRACAYADAMDFIDAIPATDVQPVKKGHWYHNTSKYISELDAYFIQACCSCCGRYSDRIDNYSQIMTNETCSHCGARMDGDLE